MTSMADTVFRHELRLYSRDGRVKFAVGLTLLLALAAITSGSHYAWSLERERRVANGAEHARWQNQGPKNAHSAAHYGIYAFKPASPLAAIDQGVEPFLGSSVWLEAHHMNEFVHRPAQDGTALTRFGTLTAALIVQVLLPLLIIVLAYDSFTSDRERGTLRLLLSAGVAPAALLRGKLLALGAVLAVVVVPVSVGGAFVATWASTVAVPDRGARLALLAAVYVAYLAGWALLTLAVSARARTSRQALMALLAAWTLGCVVLPRVAADVAGGLHPIPSGVDFRGALLADMGPAHSAERAAMRRDSILAAHGVTRVEDLSFDWRGISLQAEEELNFPIFDRHFNALFDVYRAQDAVLQVASLLAPALAIQSLSHAITATDFEHHRPFVFAAEGQRRVIQKLMNDAVTRYDKEGGPDHQSGAELWSRVPEFRYAGPAISYVLPNYSASASLLALWLLSTALLARSLARGLQP